MEILHSSRFKSKQKNRLSEIISLLSELMENFWTNDIVKELELDISLVSNLMSDIGQIKINYAKFI